MVRIARWIVLALVLAIAAVTLGPVWIRPVTGAPPDVERGVAFAVFGGTIALACQSFRNLLVSVMLASVFAATLEASQNLVPGRDGHIGDLVAKAFGLVVGAAVVWILQRRHDGPGS